MDAPTGRFIERMGHHFESDGFPPIAGRIFGLLLLDEGSRSLDELAELLGVSKASASTNARLLAGLGMLERIERPGDRRDYYHVGSDLVARTMSQRLARWQRFAETIGEARATVPAASPVVRARLEAYAAAYADLGRLIGRAMARWRPAATRGRRTAIAGRTRRAEAGR